MAIFKTHVFLFRPHLNERVAQYALVIWNNPGIIDKTATLSRTMNACIVRNDTASYYLMNCLIDFSSDLSASYEMYVGKVYGA